MGTISRQNCGIKKERVIPSIEDFSMAAEARKWGGEKAGGRGGGEKGKEGPRRGKGTEIRMQKRKKGKDWQGFIKRNELGKLLVAAKGTGGSAPPQGQMQHIWRNQACHPRQEKRQRSGRLPTSIFVKGESEGRGRNQS